MIDDLGRSVELAGPYDPAMRRAARTTKRQRKAAARGYVAPVRTRQGVTFIVDEPAQYEALRGAFGELALDTREQSSKRIG